MYYLSSVIKKLNIMDSIEIAWYKFDFLVDSLGAYDFLFSLAQALGTDKLNEYCDFISRCYGIDFKL